MEPIISQTHLEIQYGVQRGINTAENKILAPLGLTGSYTHPQIENLILSDLKAMNFKIEHASSLTGPNSNQSIPAFIQLNGFDRKQGGVIKLNQNYPKKALKEALYHEYAHIKDETLPIYISDLNAPNSRATYVTPYLKLAEHQADMTAYSLMMPPEQMKKDLFRCGYDMDLILNKYKNLEKSSVLHWITLINPLPCHFVWLIIEKDTTGNIVRIMAHDNCFYDHQNDPRPFIIQSALSEPRSAAAEAIRGRKNVKKDSIIEGTEYFCYAYYEPDQSTEVIKDYFPCSINVKYDRLLVIGWTKQINEAINLLKQTVQAPL